MATSSRQTEHQFGEENVFETARLSLFDVNMEKARASNKKHLVHHLAFVAKIHPSVSERREIGGYYERLFKQLHSQLQGETFTGLLLIYPSHILHVVETSTNMLQEVIRSLDTSERSGSGVAHETKILVYAYDIPTRLFSQWSFRVLNIPTSRMDSYNTLEPIETVVNNKQLLNEVEQDMKNYQGRGLNYLLKTKAEVSEAISLLLKLGEYIGKIPKVNLKVTMDQLHEKVPDMLMPQDMIEYLTQSNDLCSPKDYLDHYSKPFDVVLDSEIVWPIPSYLLPIS